MVKGDVASNIHDLCPENLEWIMKEGKRVIAGTF